MRKHSRFAIDWLGTYLQHGELRICWASKSVLSLLHWEVYGYVTKLKNCDLLDKQISTPAIAREMYGYRWPYAPKCQNYFFVFSFLRLQTPTYCIKFLLEYCSNYYWLQPWLNIQCNWMKIRLFCSGIGCDQELRENQPVRGAALAKSSLTHWLEKQTLETL